PTCRRALRPPPRSCIPTPYTTLFRSAGYDARLGITLASLGRDQEALAAYDKAIQLGGATPSLGENRGIVLMRLGRAAAAVSDLRDRKSTRLNSSHGSISYAVFCLKKK